MSPRYFYLQLDLVGSLSPLEVRQALQEACRAVFGEAGAALPLDVLTVHHLPTGGRALVRVPGRELPRARAALALAAPSLRVLGHAASLQALLMSVTRIESGPGGKDVLLLASPEALAAPSRVTLPEPEPAAGLILPDGSINWGCPCLGGMATGPCAQPFREAFSCFHYSEADPKGSDCYEKFSEMQVCMAQYPELYGRDDDDDDALLPAPADPALADPAPADPAPADSAPAATAP